MAMTEQQVREWLRSKGVDDNVIAQEAGYVAEKYADPDEDPEAVLNASLGSYLQRSRSGGNRDEGGYSTDHDDPAMGMAPARTDSPLGFPVGGAGGGQSSYGALMGGGSVAGFGGVPAPFGETYTPLARPSHLQGPFTLPTQAELESSPGYLAGQDAMQRGMERSAAARGSVLSGGFVGRALPRAMAEYAGSAYGNLVNQQLGARNVNEGAYTTDVGNLLAGYNARYGQYLDRVGMKRQAEQDLWGRNMDVSDLGLRAAALARP